MNRSLLITRLFVPFLLLNISIIVYGQTPLLSESFSGFTTGTHSSPSTYDISANLDSKTESQGWTGSKIYSAGGEIKLGTAEIPGWIETPLISFSENDGGFLLQFDISCRTGEIPNIQISFNGSPLGNIINPTVDFQTMAVPVSFSNCSGKIKIESLDKRFFIDNIIVKDNNLTSIRSPESFAGKIDIFPNPAKNNISIVNTAGYKALEIIDKNGKILKLIVVTGTDRQDISLTDLPSGIYFIRLISDKRITVRQIIKCE